MMKKDSQSKLIGLVADQSPDLLVGLFGILKSGNGFVPITPSTPNERIGLVINDCRIEVLVTESRYLDKILTIAKDSPCLRHVICVDAVENKQSLSDGVTVHDCAEFAGRDSAGTNIGSTPDEVLYVIFTSGSTGTPKGVPITHRNLAPLITWSEKYFKLDERTRVLQNLSYGFDFGIFELLTTALFGGTLYYADRENIGDLPRYVGYIEKHEINTLHTTPSSFKEIIRAADRLGSLEKIHFGGEELTRDLVDEVSRVVGGHCAIYNGYGPTEASINCAIFRVGDKAAANHELISSIPIGKATSNSYLFVLDKHCQPVPIGVPGELHVGGDGLASGYLNRPDLTAEKFIPNPFGVAHGARMYKTGDRAWYLPGGEIEFLGRVDDQIKIRGLRIEPGEVESGLLTFPGVKQAKVLAREDLSGRKQLAAYLITENHAELDLSGLRSHLKVRLPHWMIPEAFTLVEEWPVTASGKVDRNALSKIEPLHFPTENCYEPPNTETQARLAEIFAEVLRLERVGINHDFFELGGNSLLAMQIVSRIKNALQVEVSLIDLIGQAPTVATLSSLIEQRILENASTEEVLRALREMNSIYS